MKKSLTNLCYALGALSIPLSVMLWFLVKGNDKGSGEGWGIFVGCGSRPDLPNLR